MSTHSLFRGHAALLSGCLLTLLLSLGCKPKPATEAPAPDVPNAQADSSDLNPPSDTVPPNEPDVESPSADPQSPAVAISEPPTFELSAEALLAARLPADQTADGWVRLFDGSTLFGWQIAGSANWQVEDGAIVVDAGQRSFLATTSTWDNYELELEFQADAQTNSGVFLRTQLQPESVTTDCYELNIAPPDNPFPTGSLVERQRAEPEEVGEIDPAQWHSYHVRVDDQTITVKLDGKQVLRYEDPNRVPAGLISLQHREGRIAFRDIRIRPLGLQPLLADDNLAQWKQHPQYEGEFTIDDEGNLSIKGGSGQLESRAQFGDFALLARCRTNAKDLNSGIFFRCIPGEKMNGYECQISNETVDGDPLQPGDAGTGGIFRRQPARIVAGEDGQWVSVLLVANGPTMMAWVNGLQVSNWTDTRDPDPNPRRGLRLEPGTLMLQAHDPTTDLSFSDIAVAAIGPAPDPAWPAEE